MKHMGNGQNFSIKKYITNVGGIISNIIIFFWKEFDINLFFAIVFVNKDENAKFMYTLFGFH